MWARLVLGALVAWAQGASAGCVQNALDQACSRIRHGSVARHIRYHGFFCVEVTDTEHLVPECVDDSELRGDTVLCSAHARTGWHSHEHALLQQVRMSACGGSGPHTIVPMPIPSSKPGRTPPSPPTPPVLIEPHVRLALSSGPGAKSDAASAPSESEVDVGAWPLVTASSTVRIRVAMDERSGELEQTGHVAWDYRWTITPVAPPTSTTPAAATAAAAEAAPDLDDPAVCTGGRSSRNLVLAPHTLAPGMAYRFDLTVAAAGARHLSSVRTLASLSLVVNRPPSGGRMFASPASGTELETRFSLRAEGWADEQLPLTYAFAYSREAALPPSRQDAGHRLATGLVEGSEQDGAEANAWWQQAAEATALTGRTAATSASAILPSGTFILWLTVTDALGAASVVRAFTGGEGGDGRLVVRPLTRLDSAFMASVLSEAGSAKSPSEAAQICSALATRLNADDDEAGAGAPGGPHAGRADSKGQPDNGRSHAAAAAREQMLSLLVQQQQHAQRGAGAPGSSEPQPPPPSVAELAQHSATIAAVVGRPEQLSGASQQSAARLVSHLASSTAHAGIDKRTSSALVSSISSLLTADDASLPSAEAADEVNAAVEKSAGHIGAALLRDTLPGEPASHVTSPRLNVSAQRRLPSDLFGLASTNSGGGAAGSSGTVGFPQGVLSAEQRQGEASEGVDIRIVSYGRNVHGALAAGLRGSPAPPPSLPPASPPHGGAGAAEPAPAYLGPASLSSNTLSIGLAAARSGAPLRVADLSEPIVFALKINATHERATVRKARALLAERRAALETAHEAVRLTGCGREGEVDEAAWHGSRLEKGLGFEAGDGGGAHSPAGAGGGVAGGLAISAVASSVGEAGSRNLSAAEEEAMRAAAAAATAEEARRAAAAYACAWLRNATAAAAADVEQAEGLLATAKAALPRCVFWDTAALAWSEEGCVTLESSPQPSGGAAVSHANNGGEAGSEDDNEGDEQLWCACTHLTDFSGVSFPHSKDELLEQLTSVHINTFSASDAVDALTHLDWAANREIYETVIAITVANAILLLVGCALDQRSRRLRRDEQQSKIIRALLAQDEEKLRWWAELRSRKRRRALPPLAAMAATASGAAAPAAAPATAAPAAESVDATIARGTHVKHALLRAQSGSDSRTARKPAHGPGGSRDEKGRGGEPERAEEGEDVPVSVELRKKLGGKLKDEHTVLAVFASTGNAFSRAQLVQIFMNVLMLELVTECMLFAPEDSSADALAEAMAANATAAANAEAAAEEYALINNTTSSAAALAAAALANATATLAAAAAAALAAFPDDAATSESSHTNSASRRGGGGFEYSGSGGGGSSGGEGGEGSGVQAPEKEPHQFIPWLISSLICSAVCLPGLLLFKSIWSLRDWPFVRGFVREPSADERHAAAVLVQTHVRVAQARKAMRVLKAERRLDASARYAAALAIEDAWRKSHRARDFGLGRIIGHRRAPRPDAAAAPPAAQPAARDGAGRPMHLSLTHAQALAESDRLLRMDRGAVLQELLAKDRASGERAAPPIAAPEGRSKSGAAGAKGQGRGHEAVSPVRRLERLELLRRLHDPTSDGAVHEKASALAAGGESGRRRYAQLEEEEEEEEGTADSLENGWARTASRTRVRAIAMKRNAAAVAPQLRLLFSPAKPARFVRRRRYCSLPAASFDVLAWACMIACNAFCASIVIIYADVFGKEQTSEMLLSWSGALGQTFVLQEPMWLFVMVGLPYALRYLAALPCMGSVIAGLDALGFETEACVEWVAWLSDAC